MKHSDISFALTLVLHSMSPPNTKTMGPSGTTVKPTAEIRAGSLTFTGMRDTKTSAKINTSLYQVSFLALKIMVICFELELMKEWLKIGRTLRELGKRNEAATYLWDFLDFMVTHRTALYILMQPFIFQKLAQPPISDFERNVHTKIRNKMRSIGLPFPKSRAELLIELAHEMKTLKEELEETSESISEPKKDTCQMTSEISQPRHQRHSLIGLFTGEGHHGTKSAPTQVKESSTSTSHVSSPNQVANMSDVQEGNENGSSPLPTQAADRSSQRSSVSDEPLPKSESLQKVHKLRFVSSVEFKHSSGETSTTPLSPSSPVDDSSGEIYPNKPRLQRVKPQSRKTFRLRRSKKNKQAERGCFSFEVVHAEQESETSAQQSQDLELPPPTPPTASQLVQQSKYADESAQKEVQEEAQKEAQKETQKQEPPSDPHRLRIATRAKAAEGSWDEDSMMSQTSSTSGYRESYPVMLLKEPLESSPKAFQPPLASPDVHSLPSTSSAATTTATQNFSFLDNSSPDCSLNESGDKTALLAPNEKSKSQQSLLMVLDQQDENTLI